MLIRTVLVPAVLTAIVALTFAQSAAAQNNCYAYRVKGSSSFSIACYPSADACNSNKADYTKKQPSIEAIGCAPQIYCFTHNAEGTAAACYLDVNQCAKERATMASKGGPVGGCVTNTRPGKPPIHAYGPPSSCFTYYELGSSVPTVYCARTPAACTQAMADKKKALQAKGGSGRELNMTGCTPAIYCYRSPKVPLSIVTCHPSADACEKARAADKSPPPGACTLNDYQDFNPPKS